MLDIKKILAILPHRYPFLLIDKVVEIDLDKPSIVAIKNVTINEPFFQGHFPGAPIMPGVLLLEALAQAGGILVHQKGFNDKIAVFLSVDSAKFRNPVKPGDVLWLHVEGIHFSSKGGKVKAVAKINNDKVAVDAEVAFALVDRNAV
jgi:3-hydroxyacyl-[acyl-carrier-protein] dehydratase